MLAQAETLVLEWTREQASIRTGADEYVQRIHSFSAVLWCHSQTSLGAAALCREATPLRAKKL